MELPPEPPLLSKSWFPRSKEKAVTEVKKSGTQANLPLLSIENRPKISRHNEVSLQHCEPKFERLADVDPHAELLNSTSRKRISPKVDELLEKGSFKEGTSSLARLPVRAKLWETKSELFTGKKYCDGDVSTRDHTSLSKCRQTRAYNSTSSHSDDNDTHGFDTGSYEAKDDDHKATERWNPSPTWSRNDGDLSSHVLQRQYTGEYPHRPMRSFHSTPDCKTASSLSSVKKSRARPTPILNDPRFNLPKRISRDEYERQLQELELTGDISSTSVSGRDKDRCQDGFEPLEEEQSPDVKVTVDEGSKLTPQSECQPDGGISSLPSVTRTASLGWRARYASGDRAKSNTTVRSWDLESRSATFTASGISADSVRSSSTLTSDKLDVVATNLQAENNDECNPHCEGIPLRVPSDSEQDEAVDESCCGGKADDGEIFSAERVDSRRQNVEIVVNEKEGNGKPSLAAQSNSTFQYGAQSVRAEVREGNFSRPIGRGLSNVTQQPTSGQVPRQSHNAQLLQQPRAGQAFQQLVQGPNPGQVCQLANIGSQQHALGLGPLQPLQCPQRQNAGQVLQPNYGVVIQQPGLGQQANFVQIPQQPSSGQIHQQPSFGQAPSFGPSCDGVPSQSAMMNSAMIAAQPMMMNSFNMMMINNKHYVMSKLLGRGGSSQVYEAVCPEFGICAVKMVNLGGEEEAVIEGYKNEIELMMLLKDSGRVVKLYDHEYRGSQLLVVMERGETDLDHYFRNWKSSGRILPEMIKFYWRQMLEAVQGLHDAGIVHSDLKPANFLLVSGVVKLIDFGIAKAIQADRTSVTRDVLMGTLNYLSPEAILDTQSPHSGDDKPKFKLGVKSDIWSLGCILYTMVYSRTPFQHIKSVHEKLIAITSNKHAISYPANECDPNLVDTLKRCLVRNPRDRASIEELLNHPYLTGHHPHNTAVTT